MGDFNHGHIQWKPLKCVGSKRKIIYHLELMGYHQTFFTDYRANLYTTCKSVNLSLEERIVKSEWKYASIAPLFEKRSKNT